MLQQREDEEPRPFGRTPRAVAPVGTIAVAGNQVVALTTWWDAKAVTQITASLRVTLNRVGYNTGGFGTSQSEMVLVVDPGSSDNQNSPDWALALVDSYVLPSTISPGQTVTGNPFEGGHAPGIKIHLAGDALENIQKQGQPFHRDFKHWMVAVELMDGDTVVKKYTLDAPFLVKYSASALAPGAATPVVDILIPVPITGPTLDARMRASPVMFVTR